MSRNWWYVQPIPGHCRVWRIRKHIFGQLSPSRNKTDWPLKWFVEDLSKKCNRTPIPPISLLTLVATVSVSLKSFLTLVRNIFGSLKGFLILDRNVFRSLKGFLTLDRNVFGGLKGFLTIDRNVLGSLKEFLTLDRNTLDELMRTSLPDNNQTIYLLWGSLPRHLFSWGTFQSTPFYRLLSVLTGFFRLKSPLTEIREVSIPT